MFKSLETILELTKTGFKPLSTAKPRHFAAIGKFVALVGTEIDARLKTILMAQMGSGEELVPRAVLSDMQIGEVMGALRRIAESRSLDEKFLKNLNVLFEEIQSLRRVRNIVAHQTCLVSGNKLAFHNASIARTDAAIEVNIFTLTELEHISQYAKRIGCRIVQQFRGFVPRRTFSPAKEALLTLMVHSILARTASHVSKTKKLTKTQLEELRDLNEAAHQAVTAYTEVAKTIDQNYYELSTATSKTANEFLAALLLLDAPDDQALREIPQKLKPQHQPRKRNTHPAQARLPSSTRK